MGLLDGFKDIKHKSDAAVIVQNLLEHQARAGLYSLDPASEATRLVEIVWLSHRDLFSGKFGQRPHKITVAASAIANGLNLYQADEPNRNALLLSLGKIFSELAVNERKYALNSLDQELLEASMAPLDKIASKY